MMVVLNKYIFIVMEIQRNFSSVIRGGGVTDHHISFRKNFFLIELNSETISRYSLTSNYLQQLPPKYFSGFWTLIFSYKKIKLTFFFENISFQKPLEIEVEVVEPCDFTHFLCPSIMLILKIIWGETASKNSLWV